MNARTLARIIAKDHGILHREALSRVTFSLEELELNAADINETTAAEIEHHIAADIRRGK